MRILLCTFMYLLLSAHMLIASAWNTLSLNGEWEYGIDKVYTQTTIVPGFPLSTKEMHDGRLWYRKVVELPQGDWNVAELELKGARFRPEVYVNGQKVSYKEGGMAKTTHLLKGVAPGQRVTLEVSLASLKDVPLEDASRIPEVDRWRSNVSSCLWDDVTLFLYRDVRVNRVLVYPDMQKENVSLKYRVLGEGAERAVVVLSDCGKELSRFEGPAESGENNITFSYAGLMAPWTPESPSCYKVSVTLCSADGKELSSYEQPMYIRDFTVKDKQFNLNGEHISLRGGSVVWHRWVRDEEGRELGHDMKWFTENVIIPMKDRGANYLRFHLGVPPESVLDLCDKHGLIVQYEWNFFHGMPASLPSLVEQYASWLDLASRHPSVLMFHPYNETEEDELVRVWTALDSLTVNYPPMVMADRDVWHIHRYWWGMSENLGLYFNSYKQFTKPVMIDEFGGIYLDGNGVIGGYPMLPDAMLRWLGYENSAEQRLHQQDLAYGKVGEYWRRIGAAGVAAFPIICSWDDGNHWFVGNIKDGVQKNIWNVMTPVWADRSVSMDIWDKNFTSGQTIKLPLHFINDSSEDSDLHVRVEVLGNNKNVVSALELVENVAAHDRKIKNVKLRLPVEDGEYTLAATLVNPSPSVRYPVTSLWEVRVITASVPEKLHNAKVFVPWRERELRRLVKSRGISRSRTPEGADLLLFGARSWKQIEKYLPAIDAAVRRGTSALILSAGDRRLGKAYIDKQKNLGATTGRPSISSADIDKYPMIAGLNVTFVQQAEGESHIHPSKMSSVLWENLPADATRLWNGLRGGVIVPASSMEVNGLSQKAYVNQWVGRGADPEKIKTGPYYSYEYCGFYTYSDNPESKEAEKYLRDKVRFLIEDMPALELALPTLSPVRVENLHAGYQDSEGGRVSQMIPLAVAGKGLVRTPIVKILFDEGEGSMIISQLLTEGRLVKGCAPYRKWYPLKQDEATVQFVLNMMGEALE